jgi:hypothetical protein
MRIGTVLCPAVLLAFVDGAGFLQYVDSPTAQGRIAFGLSLVISIDMALAGTDP